MTDKETLFKFVFDEDWTISALSMVDKLHPFRYNPDGYKSQEIWNNICATLLSKREADEKRTYLLTPHKLKEFIYLRFSLFLFYFLLFSLLAYGLFFFFEFVLTFFHRLSWFNEKERFEDGQPGIQQERDDREELTATDEIDKYVFSIFFVSLRVPFGCSFTFAFVFAFDFASALVFIFAFAFAFAFTFAFVFFLCWLLL